MYKGGTVIEESLKKDRIQEEQVDQVFMGSAIHAENEDFISPRRWQGNRC